LKRKGRGSKPQENDVLVGRQIKIKRRWFFGPAWQGVLGGIICLVVGSLGLFGLGPPGAEWLLLLGTWSLVAAAVVARRRGSWM